MVVLLSCCVIRAVIVSLYPSRPFFPSMKRRIVTVIRWNLPRRSLNGLPKHSQADFHGSMYAFKAAQRLPRTSAGAGEASLWQLTRARLPIGVTVIEMKVLPSNVLCAFTPQKCGYPRNGYRRATPSLGNNCHCLSIISLTKQMSHVCPVV